MKYITDHPFFAAKFTECEERIKQTEEILAKNAGEGLTGPLKDFFVAEINKRITNTRNQYRKKYGRSKYIPH